MALGTQGRPPRGHAKVTEDQYPEIYGRWVRGTSIHALARDFKVDWSTMNYHLQRCRQSMRNTMLRDRNEVLEELREVRSAAWECFQKSRRPMTHDEVAREIDRVAMEKGVSEELASRVIKQTTKVTNRDGDASWLNVVEAAIDLECKLTGHYEQGKREGQQQGSKGAYRAAGRSPEDTLAAMSERLAEKLTAQRTALIGGSN